MGRTSGTELEKTMKTAFAMLVTFTLAITTGSALLTFGVGLALLNRATR